MANSTQSVDSEAALLWVRYLTGYCTSSVVKPVMPWQAGSKFDKIRMSDSI